MRSIALLTNPASGAGRSSRVEELLRAAGADVATFALDEIEEAVSTKPDRLVIAGGDGSIAPVARAAGEAGVPLAVVPTGTANDFARRLGLPLELEAACRLAVRGERLTRLDLGLMDDRPFVNVASLGLSPTAAARARGLKRLLGPIAYVVGALAAGLRAQPLPCEVRCDGDPLFSGRCWQVTIACSGAFGAGASVEADPRDGLLDAVVVEARSRARLVLHARGLRAGDIAGQIGARQRRCGSATVQLERPQPFNVDGEIVRHNGRSCLFSLEPGAFQVAVP